MRCGLVALDVTREGDALHRLSSHNVLSAPVLDLSSGVEYKGFLSLADIVLDLTSRDSAEKNFLLHQLGEATRGEGLLNTAAPSSYRTCACITPRGGSRASERSARLVYRLKC